MRFLPLRRGFTLIELLVVIAVIGILAAVVLTNLNSARSRARDVQRIADIKSLQLALALFLDSNNGKYPGQLSSLASAFIPSIPTPPAGVSGVTTYTYVPLSINSGVCNSYHLGTALEQASSAVLTTDRDAVPGTDNSSVDATNCAVSQFVGSGDFYGNGDTCKTTAGGVEMCYDMTP